MNKSQMGKGKFREQLRENDHNHVLKIYII